MKLFYFLILCVRLLFLILFLFVILSLPYIQTIEKKKLQLQFCFMSRITLRTSNKQ